MIDVEKIRKDFPILKRKMQGHDLILIMRRRPSSRNVSLMPSCITIRN